MSNRKPKRSADRKRKPDSLDRLVSRRHRVSEYINPNEPDGQRLLMPGLVDDDGLKIAADHFGCKPGSITTRSLMVTEKYLNELPEYDG